MDKKHRKEYQAAWYERERQRCAEKSKRYYHAHRDEIRAATKQWRIDHPKEKKLSNLRWRLRWRFGLSLAQYEAMVAAQGGRCAICGKSPANGQRLSVDHKHGGQVMDKNRRRVEGDRVRGLLCKYCNAALGHFERYGDALLNYLEKYR